MLLAARYNDENRAPNIDEEAFFGESKTPTHKAATKADSFEDVSVAIRP